MARPPRLTVPGYPHHIIQRGNNRQIDIRGMGPENTLILVDGKPVASRNAVRYGWRGERDTRGEVLSAERIQYDGRDMHRVKVVDDQGRVRVFMQDPQRRDGTRGGPPQPPSRDEEDDN